MTGTVLVPVERVHGRFNVSELMRECLVDNVEEEVVEVNGDEDDDEQRGSVGVEDIPLVLGAPSDRFRMGTSEPPPIHY